MPVTDVLAWVGPPKLARHDLRRRARLLWLVSWPVFGVVALLLALAVAAEPDTLARRATTVAAIGVLVFTLHLISRSGRPVLASWMFVMGLTVIVTQRAWHTGGIHAPVAVFYVIFIVAAGVLLGTRGGLATAVACVAGALVLTIGTSQAWLTPPPGAGSALGGLVLVLLAIGLAVVLQLMAGVRPQGSVDVDAVQMIVHDMRSPLHTVLAHLELLRQDARGEGLVDVEGAINGASRLHRLTTNLLDVSRLEAGRMPVHPVPTDLGDLAREVVASVRVLQPARTITVEGGEHDMWRCDPELTRRIIENLVTNAIKHTPVEGSVRVVLAQSSSLMQIAVHDQGPGVPDGRLAGLFDPYSAEGVRSAAGYESSGLGLAFCKLAAEAQGGSIRVARGTPSGSVFIVELPA